jgi:hypothetical protein
MVYEIACEQSIQHDSRNVPAVDWIWSRVFPQQKTTACSVSKILKHEVIETCQQMYIALIRPIFLHHNPLSLSVRGPGAEEQRLPPPSILSFLILREKQDQILVILYSDLSIVVQKVKCVCV